jgi:hypothetical protein
VSEREICVVCGAELRPTALVAAERAAIEAGIKWAEIDRKHSEQGLLTTALDYSVAIRDLRAAFRELAKLRGGS